MPRENVGQLVGGNPERSDYPTDLELLDLSFYINKDEHVKPISTVASCEEPVLFPGG